MYNERELVEEFARFIANREYIFLRATCSGSIDVLLEEHAQNLLREFEDKEKSDYKISCE